MTRVTRMGALACYHPMVMKGSLAPMPSAGLDIAYGNVGSATGSPLMRFVPRFCVFLVASALSLLLGTGYALADKRVALVIGNSGYTGVPRLKNPANDAPDFAAALREIGFDVILRVDATKNDFDRALVEFARKSANADVALVYYAGHGVQYQGSNYLLPTDIDVQDAADVRFRAVNAGTVQDALEPTSGVKVLILDACRDNPFGRTQTASRAASAIGLARIGTSSGMIVVYATASNQVAMDGDGRNSPFAHALIGRVKEPGLEVSTLFKRVAADVADETKGFQKPEITSNVIGDFYINPAESDRMAWDRIRNSQDAADFQKFIAKFPTSDLTLAAQYRLDMFERSREAADQRRRAADRDAAERIAATRRDAELADTQRREHEQQDADRRTAADRQKVEAAQRTEAARIAAETQRQEQARLEAQRKLDADRAKADEAQRIEAARVAAEAQRQEQARLEVQRKLDADRSKTEDAQRREALLAAQRIEAQRVAEAKRVEDESKRVAMLQQQELDRRQAELEKRRIDELCQTDAAELARLVAARQPDAIDQFRKRATCPTIGATAEAEGRKLRTVLAQACDADRKTLKGLKRDDLPALRQATDGMTCDAVRGGALQQIARLEDDKRQLDAVCADETQRFNGIDTAATEGQRKLSDFGKAVTCVTLQPQVGKAIADLQTRTRDVQKELARVGCYSGKVTGTLDDPTKESIERYLTKKGVGTEARLTSDFLSELRNQSLSVCGEPSPPVANVPAQPAVQKANVEPPHDAVKATETKNKKTLRAKREEDDEDEEPAKPSRPKIKRVVREEPEEAPAPRVSRPRVKQAIREEAPPPRVRERIAPPVVRVRPERPAPIARRAPARPPAPVAYGGGGGGGGGSAPRMTIQGSGF